PHPRSTSAEPVGPVRGLRSRRSGTPPGSHDRGGHRGLAAHRRHRAHRAVPAPTAPPAPVTSKASRKATAPAAGGPAAFPLYLTSAFLARTADEGARVALVMLASQRAGSPALGGALVAALMIPHVIAAPVAGALADSVRRR